VLPVVCRAAGFRAADRRRALIFVCWRVSPAFVSLLRLCLFALCVSICFNYNFTKQNKLKRCCSQCSADAPPPPAAREQPGGYP
jgi:hypothetical protein